MLRLNTVLCAIDFQPGSERALIRAADLAERAHATLHLLHISPLFRARLALTPDGVDTFRDRVAVFVNQALGADDAFDVLDPVVHHGHGEVPAEGLVRYAEAVNADLIVLGTHGRSGMGHVILGSVAADTLRTAKVPVLVIPERGEGIVPTPENPVLVAVDFSEFTRPTLKLALDMSEAFGAPLELAHVLDRPAGSRFDLGGFLGLGDLPVGPESGDREKVEASLRALLGELDVDEGDKATHVLVGTAEVELARLAEERNAGLFVVGTHGRTGWAKVRLGSVAESVLRTLSCPVLVLPALALEAMEEQPSGADAESSAQV